MSSNTKLTAAARHKLPFKVNSNLFSRAPARQCRLQQRQVVLRIRTVINNQSANLHNNFSILTLINSLLGIYAMQIQNLHCNRQKVFDHVRKNQDIAIFSRKVFANVAIWVERGYMKLETYFRGFEINWRETFLKIGNLEYHKISTKRVLWYSSRFYLIMALSDFGFSLKGWRISAQ